MNRSVALRTLVRALFLLGCLCLVAVVHGEQKPGLLESRGLPRILFNNDSDDLKWPAYPEHHDAVWVPAGDPLPSHPLQSLEDYLALRIGPLAKSPVTGLSYCGNFGSPLWQLRRDRIAALGEDPLQAILGFWKQDGRRFFFSVRMNDKHHAWFNWAHLWDDFRRTHRQWFLKPPTDEEWQSEYLPWLEDKTKPGPKEMWAKPQTPLPLALRAGPSRERNGEDLLYDYSKAEVRLHYLEVLREACRRYDLDGVELDWLRYPKFFRDGEVNAAVMTEFVREVRATVDEAARRRGHPVRLVSRLPDSPARAKELGLDAGAWLQAGWLDAVIAGNGFTFSSNELDQWVTLAHRYDVPVYGALERMPRGFARYGTPETLRAAAAVLWARGADGLYTFNFYNTAEYPLLGELADPDQLARLPKEFFLDACSVPNNATVSQPPLPLAIQANSSARTVLFITDEPARSKDLRLELAWKGSVDLAAPSIRINGVELKELKLDRDKTDFTAVSASRLEQGESFLTIACNSASLATLLRRGANDFVFTSTSAATLTALSLKITPEFQKPTSPAK